MSFNLRYKTKDREIRTAQTVANVQGPASTPRSFNVVTDRGSIRRNRDHLNVLPERGLSCSDVTLTEPRQKDSGVTVTNSGRVSCPPDRLDRQKQTVICCVLMLLNVSLKCPFRNTCIRNYHLKLFYFSAVHS